MNLGPVMTSGCSPIPVYMDTESYAKYLPFSMESFSGFPVDITSTPTPPQMSVLDGRWSNISDIHDPQVRAEAHTAGLCSSLYPPIYADTDTNHNWGQAGISMDAPCLQYSGIHATPDSPVLSTPPDNYSLPIEAHLQEEASTEIPQRSGTLGNGPTGASSRSPPKRTLHRCNICGKCYAQKSGATRHCREAHEDSWCPHCKSFKFHRRQQLGRHIKEKHPNIHLPAALNKLTTKRRRATLHKNRSERQKVFLYNRLRRGEHLSQPLTQSPALGVTNPSSPVVSFVAYDPQPKSTMPTFMNLTQGRAPPPFIEHVFFWGSQ